jgi:WXXGXW repeat (2 copies)
MSTNIPTLTFPILLLSTCWICSVRQTAAQDQGGSSSGGAEVLARGPVHEAFAEPLNLQGADPIVIAASPPKPVEELPPDEKPEGSNVQWIPGYWAWDEDRNDFVWVSGVWRDCPPGQKWVPGYWSKSDGDWSWSAGFWVSEAAAEVEYLPEPPETLEEGPTIEAPSQNHIWVPGVWRYIDARYAWRPGYWTIAQPDWLWAPAHYVWTPSGYVFVDGFWDYPLVRRGVLFAPVYYQQPTYLQANYYYTPSTVISTDLLTVHLFARPRYCHYYFGDYYAPRYREIGIEPWLMLTRIRGCYDPLFSYYAWSHRRDGRDWNRIVRDRYDFFDRNREYRPAHTFADLRRQRFEPIRTGDTNIQKIVVQQNNLVLNFNQFVQNERSIVQAGGDRSRGLRFAKLGDDDRRALVDQAKAVRGFEQRRSEIENPRSANRRSRSGAVADTDRRAGPTLSLSDLRNGATTQRGDRDQRGRSGPQLPPSPEQSSRGSIGRSGPETATEPVAKGSPDATRNSGRDRLPDATQGHGPVSSRDGAGPNTNAKSDSQRDSIGNFGDDNSAGRNRGPATIARDDAKDPPGPPRPNTTGPFLNPPEQAQTRRNSEGRALNTDSQANQRRTSNYPSSESRNSAERYRDPAAGKLPLQDKVTDRFRETTSPGTSRNSRLEDRGFDRHNSESKERRSGVPQSGGAANNAREFRGLNPPPTDGTQQRRSTNVDQFSAQSGSGRAIPRSSRGSSPQLGSDSNQRPQLGRGNYSAPRKDDRGSDRAASSSPRSARDAAITIAPRGDASQKGGAQGKRVTRPQSKGEEREGDKRSKRRDKEDEER